MKIAILVWRSPARFGHEEKREKSREKAAGGKEIISFQLPSAARAHLEEYAR